MCLMDHDGFPRTRPKQQRLVQGFQTGDIVKAVVPTGKNAGSHTGRVAVRTQGSFRVGNTDGISWKYCQLVHRLDGYAYSFKERTKGAKGAIRPHAFRCGVLAPI
jgi:hypothetical protein